MDTEAFDFVLGTDFFVQHTQLQSLMLQAPYLLYVAHADGRESVPLEQSEYTSSYLRVSKEEPSNMMAASKTEDYQLLGEVMDQGLKELCYSREDLSVELFASDKQHVLDLYCSKGKNCCYKFYWPSFGMAYGNPRTCTTGHPTPQPPAAPAPDTPGHTAPPMDARGHAVHGLRQAVPLPHTHPATGHHTGPPSEHETPPTPRRLRPHPPLLLRPAPG